MAAREAGVLSNATLRQAHSAAGRLDLVRVGVGVGVGAGVGVRVGVRVRVWVRDNHDHLLVGLVQEDAALAGRTRAEHGVSCSTARGELQHSTG